MSNPNTAGRRAGQTPITSPEAYLLLVRVFREADIKLPTAAVVANASGQALSTATAALAEARRHDYRDQNPAPTTTTAPTVPPSYPIHGRTPSGRFPTSTYPFSMPPDERAEKQKIADGLKELKELREAAAIEQREGPKKRGRGRPRKDVEAEEGKEGKEGKEVRDVGGRAGKGEEGGVRLHGPAIRGAHKGREVDDEEDE